MKPSEGNQPRESRRERTAREQAEARRLREEGVVRARRLSRIKVVGLSLLAAVGVVTASFVAYESLKGGDQVDPASYFPANRSLWESLRNLDGELARGRVDITQVAPTIIGLADKAVCADIGCDPNEVKGKYKLLDQAGFAQAVFSDFDGCKNPQQEDLTGKQVFAATGIQADFPIFDITDISYLNVATHQRRLDQATGLYSTEAHERIHANGKIVKPENETGIYLVDGSRRKVIMRRGARKLFEKPEDSKPGMQCLGTTNVDVNFDEAIVEQAKRRVVLRELGNSLPAPMYTPMVNAYEQNILPLFGGDNRSILHIQQEGDPDKIYELIGAKKLPGGSPELQRQIGQNLVVETFVGYIR